MTIITKAGLAAELGVSKARVSQYVQRGLPQRADGRLDRDAALRWLKRNERGVAGSGKGADRAARLLDDAGSPPPPRSAGGIDPIFERARKDRELADRIALQNALARGEVIPAADAEAAWIAIIGVARERLLGMPSKLAPRLVGLTSAAVALRILEAEVYAALTDLAGTEVHPLEPEDLLHAEA